MIPLPAFVVKRIRMLHMLFLAVAAATLFQAGADGLRLLGIPLPDLCLYHALGHACPGCGTTRATVLLLQGQFKQSLAMQPALPCFLLAAFLFHLRATPWRRRGATALLLCGLILATWHMFRPALFLPA